MNSEKDSSIREGLMKRAGNLLCCAGLLALALSVCLLGANVAAAQETGAVSYLKCNIHYQQHTHDAKASYANWTDPGQGHMILPVNTQVEIGRFRGGFSIVALPTKKEIYFEYNEKNMQMTQRAVSRPHHLPHPRSTGCLFRTRPEGHIGRKGVRRDVKKRRHGGPRLSRRPPHAFPRWEHVGLLEEQVQDLCRAV